MGNAGFISSTVVEAHDPLPAIPTKLTKKLLQDLLVDVVIFREGELPGAFRA